MMMASIREKILDYLRQNRTASVAAMALALSVTKQDVRYHLRTLLSERLVEKVNPTAISVNPERGRPKAAFQLTSSARQNNYQALTSTLLRHFFAVQANPTGQDAGKLASLLFRLPNDQDEPLVQRLNNLVDQLREHEYAPRWEAHDVGPRIIFENCPYAAILADFPQLCEMDREFIQSYSGMQTDILQTAPTSKRKPPACIFRIKATG